MIDDDDPTSEFDPLDDERVPCAGGCGRPVFRDEARRLPEGGHVCEECWETRDEPGGWRVGLPRETL